MHYFAFACFLAAIELRSQLLADEAGLLLLLFRHSFPHLHRTDCSAQ
jgi:hypothetical protein